MKRQHGFGAIAAIVVLVILAVLAAAIVSVSTTQQVTSAQDVMSARAWQAARAGNEWGLYKALKGSSCVGSPGTTLPLSATGFSVTVVCDKWPPDNPYNEGQTCTTLPCVAAVVTVYRITAVACPATSSTCPASDASVAGAGYIERTRVVIATDK